MPQPSPRRSRGNSRPAAPRLTTARLLAVLTAEGFYVTRRILYHAAETGFIKIPPRAGNHRRWTPRHVAGLRRYLRENSRSQSDDVIGGGR